MKNCLSPILISILCANVNFAQNDTLNKSDSLGKRSGYWRTLLDDKINPVENIQDAYFYRLELWDQGKVVYKYYQHKKIEKMSCECKLPERGKPVLIDGTFRWYDRNNNIKFEELYENGLALRFKSFFSPIGRATTANLICEDVDFTTRYNNIPGTIFARVFPRNPNRKITEGWYRKGKKKWRWIVLRKIESSQTSVD